MYYLNDDGDIFNTDNNLEIALYGYLSEIKLYKYENPYQYTSGVDYVAILAGEAFLKDGIEAVTKKYTNKFKNITIGNVEQTGEIVKLNINVIQKNNETKNFSVGV